MEVKVEQELDIRIKGRRKGKVFEIHFFCSGIAQNVFLLFLWGMNKAIGRHAWKVNMSGECWKAEESVLFFIYTPVITVSLASKYDE